MTITIIINLIAKKNLSMENRALPNCYSKMAVKQSPVEGFGVFALKKIKAGEILEEVPYIVWSRFSKLQNKMYNLLKEEGFLSQDEINYEDEIGRLGFKGPSRYYFDWSKPGFCDGKNFQCLPLGYGPIYNSTNGLNNAEWVIKEKTFVFKAIKNIKPGEEIKVFYGYMISDNGKVFSSIDVFDLGMECIDEVSGIVIRDIKYPDDKNKKEEGYIYLKQYLAASEGNVKINRIVGLQSEEEKEAFDFPKDYSLYDTLMKLKYFKNSGFDGIKLDLCFFDNKNKRDESKSVILNINQSS